MKELGEVEGGETGSVCICYMREGFIFNLKRAYRIACILFSYMCATSALGYISNALSTVFITTFLLFCGQILGICQKGM